jgi:hypothetical protein
MVILILVGIGLTTTTAGALLIAAGLKLESRT